MRLIIPLLLLALSTVADAEVVDRVVVVVEDELVLASDIQLDEALTPLDPSPSLFWVHPRMQTSERAVEAAILRHLAGDVTYYEPSDDEVRARIEGIRANFLDRASWLAFLASWGLDEQGLMSVVRRRLVVERYLARNLQVEPTDRQLWHATYAALLEGVRERLRIRYVEAKGE